MRTMTMTGALTMLATALPAQGGDRTEVWTHLASQYDTDGDGKISPAEHGRGDRQFKNLDRNGDGFITAADFEQRRRSGARRSGATDASARTARLAHTLGDMYGSFLNTDGEPGLSAADWDAVISLLAADDNGVIAEKNLANLTGLAGQGRMASYGGRGMSKALDHDGDGTITVADLRAVFAAIDVNGNGLVEQGEEIDMPPGVGEMATDFTLPFAADKDKTVTLSSFRGDKPVALIFGSYT